MKACPENLLNGAGLVRPAMLGFQRSGTLVFCPGHCAENTAIELKI